MNWKSGLFAASLLLPAVKVCAQDVEIQTVSIRRPVQPSTSSPAQVIKASSNLVLVPVHVTNRAGVAVNGLDADAFTVLEDKNPQPIVSFGNEDVPCSVGIILDLSGSMSSKITLASSALRSFLDTANPEDDAFLLTVSTTPQTVSDFTADFGLVQSRLLSAATGGATALVDTIYMAVSRMRKADHAHKAILVISDGMDNHSRYTSSELLHLVEEADVQIYTISVQTWSPFKKPIELSEERNGQAFLQTLSDRTGGLNWAIRDLSEAPAAAAALSRAIREQYVIGYRPDNSRDYSGKWRTIQVKVNMPRTHVSSRTGYYAR